MATTTESTPRPPETTPPPPPAPGERAGWFTPYKEDQGRHVRMAAFWSLIFFLIFGCRYLHDLLIRFESLGVALGGIKIPVLGVRLTGAFLISFWVFALGALLIYRWQQRPRTAELLIETENELRKVTWPSGREVLNASMVVIVSVLLIGLFLAFSDLFLARVMRYLLLGET
jgi:preprotein translocase SecE subunit